ncbi:MBL fold metallo-hydrolase [Brevibacterium litoralis]|uniref:MBL fold metallo-hydrolase n=1 Tax=Brevibacterium litoralis TaxID=3138935 RepID=UPI003D9A222A
MRLTAVGTSGSFPGPASAASCYVLETADADRTYRVVLDLGNGAAGPLQSYTDLADVDAIVLSHLHADHCLDLTVLFVQHRYDPRFFDPEAGAGRPRLPVWGPGGTRTRLEAAYHVDPGLSPRATEAHPTDMTEAFDFHDVTPGHTFAIGPLHFEAFLVDHPVESYAYRITDRTDGTVLTYSGDTDACEGLTAAAREADLFLCEAAFEEGRDTVCGIHLTGQRAGETAQAAGARSLVLTHIPPWTDRDVVRTEAAGRYAGPIDLAETDATWTIAPEAPCSGRHDSEQGRATAAPSTTTQE